MRQLLTAIVIALTVGIFMEARADAPGRLGSEADLSRPMELVASPDLSDKLYSKTVLLVFPVSNDQHVGFILNKPTPQTLGSLFPTDEASKRANSRVYLGGPTQSEAIFAMVKVSERPKKALCLVQIPNLCLVADGAAVDEVIAKSGDSARYFAGFVLWKPGELAEEMRKGLWIVGKATADHVFRQSTSLWDELARSRGVNTLAPNGAVLVPVQWRPITVPPSPIKRGMDGDDPLIIKASDTMPPAVVSRNSILFQKFVEHMRSEAIAAGEDPSVWTIIDTGDSALREGEDGKPEEWPLVRISKKGQPNECLIEVGPKGWIPRICMPVEIGVMRFL